MNAPQPDFRALQFQFTAHLRDPAGAPMPEGIEQRRMTIYRELIFNNIENLLSTNFPVIRKILSDRTWEALVRDFMIEHRAQTPIFTEVGRELIRYLELRAERAAGDPPFLLELAHYEWVELAVSLDEADIERIEHDPQGDLLQGRPLVSPLAWPLAYRFPVQMIGPGFQPQTAPAEPTCLIVTRRRDDSVAFVAATPMTLKLIELLKENPQRTGLESVKAIAELFEPGERPAAIAGATQMLHDLRARDVILGTH